MIESFSVENFLSIKEKQTISFVANKRIRNSSDEHLLIHVSDSVKLLKFCVLYGYNASGKTNLLLALNYLRKLIISEPSSDTETTHFTPFALSNETKNQPGIFTLNFYIEEIRYTYIVKLTEAKILYEELSYQPLGRKALLYSRTYNETKHVSTLKYGTYCDLSSNDKSVLTGNTIAHVTTLFAYQNSNIHSIELEKIVQYFADTVMPIVTPKTALRMWSKDKLIDDSSSKQFHLDLLKKADFQIDNLEIVTQQFPVDESMITFFKKQGAPESMIEDITNREEIEVQNLFFTHRTSEGSHVLPFEVESEGTLRYFGLAGIMHTLIAKGGIVAIDEIESSLHPELIAFILQMFLLNSTNAQIITTTHSQNIMELDYMRNDMIYFCEKNKSGASVYYSAQEFGLHKNVNLVNAYRAGKLGATPFFGSPLIEDLQK